MSKLQLTGAMPPMLTPFKANGDVDFDMHVRNLEKWNQTPLGGYLVLGSNSEAAYLNEEESLKLIELTVSRAAKGRTLLAGTGMESTRKTIALTNKAAKLGAHAALVLTPCYYGAQMNDEALIDFFTQVADQADIPILIYNVTKFTHVNISPAAVGVLCRHPNIIGMKDSSGDIPQLVRFKQVITPDFNLMVGTASAWYPALTLGVKAAIMALANCAPNACAQVQEAYEQGDHSRSREVFERVFPVNTAVTATYGVAGLKYAADLMGFEGGHVRSPLMPLKPDAKERLKAILTTAELI